MPDTDRGYTLEYNKKGLVVPPQTMDTPIGLLTGCFGLIFPIVLFAKPQLQISPLILQYTPTFHIYHAAGLLSNSDIAVTEWLIVVHLVIRFAIFPAFLKKYLTQFAINLPPPIELKHAWPRQFVGIFLFGTAAIVFSLMWGMVAEISRSLTPKILFCMLVALGMGISLFTEGVMDFGLYLVTCRTYWRDGREPTGKP